MILATDLTLVCDACLQQKQVDPTQMVDGRPVLLWWLVDRGQRCSRCAPPLADPRVNGTKLSAAARPTAADASKAAFPNSGTQRMRVLQFIERAGQRGGTDEEIADGLALNANAERPRRLELEEGGWVRDSGQKRSTRSGNDAIVWVLTDRALAQFRVAAP